jgi:5-methylthioadenosine/S-adenosylhomocysteine deaminase
MNVLIHSATIITMSNRQTVRDGAIATEGRNISDVGKTSELKRKYGRGYERINAQRKVIIPGFINTHQHAAMSLLRGYSEDLPLQEWLEKWIWPIERHMTSHDIYVGALLTAVESIMSGVTTVNTMYHYSRKENEAKAFVDSGLRGVVGHVCFSWRKKRDRKALLDLAKQWHSKADGLIRMSLDPHSPYTVDPEYMKELKQICGELNSKYGSDDAPIIWHTHIAETSDEIEKTRTAFNVSLKDGLVAYLDSLGVLDEHVVAAHCVHLTGRDIRTLKKREVKVSHNPVSNLKLASGVSPVPKLLKQGVTVSLGTDSPCSNNSADMFGVMKTAALLHKGINRNPALMPAQQVLEMATVDGAKALSWQNEIGSLEVGKRADLVIVDFNKPHLTPLHNDVSHLIYAAKPADVETVLINGEIVMENRQVKTVNVEEVMNLAEKSKQALLSRLV